MQLLGQICWQPILFVIPDQFLRSYALIKPVCLMHSHIASQPTNDHLLLVPVLPAHAVPSSIPVPQTSASV